MKQPFAKHRLFCPGPTPVSLETTMALMRTNVYHRTDDFREVVNNCRKGLQPYFGTRHLPILLTASGTGAMEACVSHLTSDRDLVLCLVAGKFGERWQKIAQSLGCEVDVLRCEDGSAVEPETLQKQLATKNYRAIFMQANETSTGVFQPIEALAKVVRENSASLLVVDAISALAAHTIEMDAWGIDALISGSQKGFGVPPGLAFVALSDKAKAAVTKRGRFYFDLLKEEAQQDEGQTAWTPATGLLLALEQALKEMNAIGARRIAEHHTLMATACRHALSTLGLELFAPRFPSNAVTSARVPAGIEGKKLLASIRDNDGAIFAGGQDHLKGKIIRMSHLGFMDRLELMAGLSALELGLHSQNFRFEWGAGLSAAIRTLGINRK